MLQMLILTAPLLFIVKPAGKLKGNIMKKLSTLGLMIIFAAAPMAYAEDAGDLNTGSSVDCTSCHGGDGTPGNLFQSNVTDIYDYVIAKLNVTKWFKPENKSDGVHGCNTCHINGD